MFDDSIDDMHPHLLATTEIKLFEVGVGHEDAADNLVRHIRTALDNKCLQLTAFLCNDLHGLGGDEFAGREVDGCHLVEIEAICVYDLVDVIICGWIIGGLSLVEIKFYGLLA